MRVLGVPPLVIVSALGALGALGACNGLTGVGDFTVAPCDGCDALEAGPPEAGPETATGDNDAAPLDAPAGDTSVEGPGGSLDPTFGAGGMVEIDPLVDAHAVAIRADGRIIVAGAFQNELAALALTATGAVDTSFGGGGRVVKGLGTTSLGRAIAFDSQGRTLVGGNSIVTATTSVRCPYVVRIGASAVDTTFGDTGGWRGTSCGEEVRGLVVTAGDSVVASVADSNDHVFRRLDGAGVLDAAFGTAGRAVVTDVGGEPFGIAAVADGFVSGGTGSVVAGNALAAAKVSLAGQPAAGFGAGGKAASKVGPNNNERGTAIGAQADGSVLVSGDYDPNVGLVKSLSALVRFTAAGQPDTTYGTGGKVTFDLSELAVAKDTEMSSASVAVDSKGRALVVGTILDRLLVGGERRRAWIVRLKADGAFDPLFGTQGRFFIGTAPARLEVRGAALQPDGKLVVVGVNLNGGKLFIARVVTSTVQ
jgi:uncharacterized delta-60 repeat protein